MELGKLFDLGLDRLLASHRGAIQRESARGRDEPEERDPRSGAAAAAAAAAAAIL